MLYVKDDESEEMDSAIQVLVNFCRSLAMANLKGEKYLTAETWLRLARELENLV
ncbi:hypothetical protein [Cuspidothrix issatschenkoi]|jgi:hypothetical protein|uniref:hypothetical protein n=1 Tax=Cuspidothrix issatschenkoi TaxID=230752 RepID=UPI0013FDC923|nr:hypothetical protein [Cuspidothrix issatschenkoi]